MRNKTHNKENLYQSLTRHGIQRIATPLNRHAQLVEPRHIAHRIHLAHGIVQNCQFAIQRIAQTARSDASWRRRCSRSNRNTIRGRLRLLRLLRLLHLLGLFRLIDNSGVASGAKALVAIGRMAHERRAAHRTRVLQHGPTFQKQLTLCQSDERMKKMAENRRTMIEEADLDAGRTIGVDDDDDDDDVVVVDCDSNCETSTNSPWSRAKRS
jgi:hypothetical protein